MSARGQFLLTVSGHFHVRPWAVFHVRRQSTFAFVDESTSSTGVSFTQTPLLFVVGVPLVCAVLGWITALILTKRGWAVS